MIQMVSVYLLLTLVNKQSIRKQIKFPYLPPLLWHMLKISLSCSWRCICIYHHHMPWLRRWQGKQFHPHQVWSSFAFHRRSAPRSGTRTHWRWRNRSHDMTGRSYLPACSTCHVTWWWIGGCLWKQQKYWINLCVPVYRHKEGRVLSNCCKNIK